MTLDNVIKKSDHADKKPIEQYNAILKEFNAGREKQSFMVKDSRVRGRTIVNDQYVLAQSWGVPELVGFTGKGIARPFFRWPNKTTIIGTPKFTDNYYGFGDRHVVDRKSTRLNSSHSHTDLVCRLLLE